MALAKLPNLSEPWFSSLWNGEIIVPTLEDCCEGLIKVNCITEYQTLCLAHDRHSNGSTTIFFYITTAAIAGSLDLLFSGLSSFSVQSKYSPPSL